jgi:hypothetical protein
MWALVVVALGARCARSASAVRARRPIDRETDRSRDDQEANAILDWLSTKQLSGG